MPTKAATVEGYIQSLPAERVEVITKLHKLIKKSLPKGFKEGIGYGMICYSVPLSLYPAGYHCNPSLPLMFMSLASQKNYIALHHMGIYSNPALLKWFTDEYPKHARKKLDMGKGCIRFKDMNDIPYDLIAALSAKMTPQQWIECYETALNSRKKPK